MVFLCDANAQTANVSERDYIYFFFSYQRLGVGVKAGVRVMARVRVWVRVSAGVRARVQVRARVRVGLCLRLDGLWL